MPVWPSQGALSGTSQEHRPDAGDVCVVELVNGAQANIAGAAGMSAPAARAKAGKQTQRGQKSVKSAANSALVSPFEPSPINFCVNVGYADLP